MKRLNSLLDDFTTLFLGFYVSLFYTPRWAERKERRCVAMVIMKGDERRAGELRRQAAGSEDTSLDSLAVSARLRRYPISAIPRMSAPKMADVVCARNFRGEIGRNRFCEDDKRARQRQNWLTWSVLRIVFKV